MKTSVICCLGLSLALGLATAQAQAIWKWKDKDGRVQVSDRPPPASVPDSAILQRPGGPAPVVVDHDQAASAPALSRPAPPAVDKALEAKRARQQAEQAAQVKSAEDAQRAQVQAKKAENCQRARGQLAVLESGQRVARPTAQGEREVLDDAGRAAEVRRMREAVAANCSS